MDLDYALVHVKFTIPLALLLTAVAKPFITTLDVTRVTFLVAVAVSATIPWDSYLIRSGVWTYPDGGVLGYSLVDIPCEELFFFVVQTYITGVLYVMCSKPVLLAQYLPAPSVGDSKTEDEGCGRQGWTRKVRAIGQVALVSLTAWGALLIRAGGRGTYLGLILAWACPFLFITWSLTGEMILSMPWPATVLPIAIPTVYLWLVDELSLRSGIWTIEDGTKLGVSLFGSLDVEEALFFFLTNTLVVFGIAAFDQAAAACDAFPELFPRPADDLPVRELLMARVCPTLRYDGRRVKAVREAVGRLSRKSRSFYIASSVFPGRVRIDLSLLYSYCRLADDLVDEASSPEEARTWITKLKQHIDLSYRATINTSASADTRSFIRTNFPPSAHTALELLPSRILSPESLYSLLDGFATDLEFRDDCGLGAPISDEADLELYASRVASTVGALCLDVVLHHTRRTDDDSAATLYAAAKEMGVALQYINIARDVEVDAAMGRVYLPTTWLSEEGLTPGEVVARPRGPAIEGLRKRLLGKAFLRYRASRKALELLPRSVRGAMTVAVESYMEIGRVLAEGGLRVEGKATVPAWRRMWVVWKTLVSS